jgi:hypothetical protein
VSYHGSAEQGSIEARSLYEAEVGDVQAECMSLAEPRTGPVRKRPRAVVLEDEGAVRLSALTSRRQNLVQGLHAEAVEHKVGVCGWHELEPVASGPMGSAARLPSSSESSYSARCSA